MTLSFAARATLASAVLLGLALAPGLQAQPTAADGDDASPRTAESSSEAQTASAADGTTETQSTTGAAAPSVPGALDVRLDATLPVTVGDRVIATLTLSWLGAAPAAPPRFPTWQDTWGSAVVVEVGSVEAEEDGAGRRIWRQRLELTAFETGEVSLPAPAVVVPLTDRSVEVRADDGAVFTVESVLPPPSEDGGPTPGAAPTDGDPAAADPAAAIEGGARTDLEPRPAAGLLPTASRTVPFLVALALLILVLAASILWLLKALDRQPAAQGEAQRDRFAGLSPIDALHRRLDEIDLDDSVAAHTRSSRALRIFLDRRLEVSAVEATTTEIQRHLHRTSLTSEEVREILDLLRACDRVKFAREAVVPARTGERVATVRRIADGVERQVVARLAAAADRARDAKRRKAA